MITYLHIPTMSKFCDYVPPHPHNVKVLWLCTSNSHKSRFYDHVPPQTLCGWRRIGHAEFPYTFSLHGLLYHAVDARWHSHGHDCWWLDYRVFPWGWSFSSGRVPVLVLYPEDDQDYCALNHLSKGSRVLLQWRIHHLLIGSPMGWELQGYKTF